MVNSVVFAVVTDTARHQIVLMQDETFTRIIHGVFDGSRHDLTDCAASVDGGTMSGSVAVLIWDAVTKIVIGKGRATLTMSGFDKMSGVISEADEANALRFVLACVANKVPLRP